jgi:two-component system cell cycle sensor histidine kinase/response regulator CckA
MTEVIEPGGIDALLGLAATTCDPTGLAQAAAQIASATCHTRVQIGVSADDGVHWADASGSLDAPAADAQALEVGPNLVGYVAGLPQGPEVAGFTATLALALYAQSLDRQRRRAVLALDAARDDQDAILDAMHDSVIGYDAQGQVLFMNASARRWAGPRNTLAQMSEMASIYDDAGELIPRHATPTGRALGGETVIGQVAHVRGWERAPCELTLILNAHPVFDPQGQVRMVIATAQDVTAIRATAAQFLAREDKLRLLTDAAPLFLATLDDRLFLRFTNRTSMQWWCCTVGDSLDKRADPATVEALRPLLQEALTGNSVTAELELAFPDGQRRFVHVSCVSRREDSGLSDGVILVMTDLTDRRRTELALQHSEEQLRHAQKMDAVGRLAGSIAHDFNNLLTAINGYSDLILAVMREGEPFHAHVEEIRRAGERAATLTGQLLAFSRKQIAVPRVLDLNVVVTDLERMLRRLIGEDVELQTDLRARPAWVMIDPGHLEQVLLNLLLNARDALTGGGRIMVETDVVQLGPGDVPGYLSAPPGSYVRLAVRDTGAGIAPDVLPHLFEPFFSTKGKGKGTGLGLSTVYGIVRQGQGALRVSTAPGEGATFEVLLPWAQPEAHLPADFAAQTRPVLPGGGERVLLVEDEAAVRRLVARILGGLGYEVHEASSGAEALRVFHQNGGQFDALVSDVVMPGMNGRELAQALTLHRPTLRVLFMSGYTDGLHVQPGSGSSSLAFIHKPFTLAAMARRLRELLDERPRAASQFAAPA